MKLVFKLFLCNYIFQILSFYVIVKPELDRAILHQFISSNLISPKPMTAFEEPVHQDKSDAEIK